MANSNSRKRKIVRGPKARRSAPPAPSPFRSLTGWQPMTMKVPLGPNVVGTFRQPVGERGSATNPLGPRSRRRAHWVPADAGTRARVEALRS